MTPGEMREKSNELDGHAEACADCENSLGAHSADVRSTLWLIAAELCERLDRIAERGEGDD